MTAKLVVVGGGKMGEALVAGLLAGGWGNEGDVVVAEAVAARREELGRLHPGWVVVSSPAEAADAGAAGVTAAAAAAGAAGAGASGAAGAGATGAAEAAGTGEAAARRASGRGAATGAVEGAAAGAAGTGEAAAAAAGAAGTGEAAAAAAGAAGTGEAAARRASGRGAATGAVVAVKPGDVEAACRSLAQVEVGRVLSIAAGVPLARLQPWLPEGLPVVRAMPNTPALVGAGAAAIAAGDHAGDEDLAWAEEILAAVGIVVRVPETLLDAVTGLSGSGPAYVFLVAEALIEAGVLVGLPRPVSQRLAVQTLLGSARLLAESDEGPEALRAAVTSPGGTTAAGLRALESAAVRSAFLDAVVAATERSRALGR